MWAVGQACAYDDGSRRIFNHLRLSARPWFAVGNGSWQMSAPLATLPKNEQAAGTTMEFQQAAGLITLVSAELRLLPRLSLDFEYGDGNRVAGLGREHNWIDAPNYDVTFGATTYTRPRRQDFSLSESALRSNTQVVAAHLYARVWPLRINSCLQGAPGESADLCHFVDLFGGYSWYHDAFRMRDGVQTISREGPFTPPAVGRLSGLDSTYHFHWEGPRFGVREEVILPRNFIGSGRLSCAPILQYRGEGYWNLRSDLRRGDPSFTHAAHGWGLEAMVHVGYRLTSLVSLDGGFLWQMFRATRGDATVYRANGQTTFADLDIVKTERAGFFLGMSFLY